MIEYLDTVTGGTMQLEEYLSTRTKQELILLEAESRDPAIQAVVLSHLMKKDPDSVMYSTWKRKYERISEDDREKTVDIRDLKLMRKSDVPDTREEIDELANTIHLAQSRD